MFSYSKEALMELGRKHWKQFRPNKYRQHVKDGTLEQALATAAARTLVEFEDYKMQGYQPHDAWELVRERYLILPEKRVRPARNADEIEAYRILRMMFPKE